MDAEDRRRTRRAAQIQKSIGQILYHDWDPIGVAGWGPEDEYDSYIGPVYRLLAGSRSEEELIQLLYRIENETIGCPSESAEKLRPLARKLLAVDVSLH